MLKALVAKREAQAEDRRAHERSIRKSRREDYGWLPSRYGSAHGDHSGVELPLWKRRIYMHDGCLDVGTAYLSPAAFESHASKLGSIIAHMIRAEKDSGGS